VPPTISPGPPVPPGSPPSPSISTPNPPGTNTYYYNHAILSNSGLEHDLHNLYGENLFYRPGLWLYVFRSADFANNIHRTTITGYLNYRMHNCVTTGAGYTTPVGGDHIIYFGHTSS
jgi:hypothetical protein